MIRDQGQANEEADGTGPAVTRHNQEPPSMKPTSSFRKFMDKIRRDCKSERFDRALTELNRLLCRWPDNPALLIMRAELIQLQDAHAASPSLDDARADLERAAELDERCPNAQIELGHFLFAVKDNPKAALRCFKKATVMCRHLLKETLLGQADVLVELGRDADARACLVEAKCIHSHNGRPSTDPDEESIRDRLNSLTRRPQVGTESNSV
jgi:tetratricopeptide (TPR) repeat protein